MAAREIGPEPEQLDVAVPESIEYARWARGRPVKVLIHGYTGDKDYSPNTEIRPGKQRPAGQRGAAGRPGAPRHSG